MALFRRKQTKLENTQTTQSGIETVLAALEGLDVLDGLAEKVLQRAQSRRMLTRKIAVTACTSSAVTLERRIDYQVSVLSILRREDGRHFFNAYATFTSEHIADHPTPDRKVVNVHMDSTIPGRERVIEQYAIGANGRPKDWVSTETLPPLTDSRCAAMVGELASLIVPEHVVWHSTGAASIRQRNSA